MKFTESTSYFGRRKVCLGALTRPWKNQNWTEYPLRLFESSSRGTIFVATPHKFHRFPAPPEAIAAFNAGADPMPLLDWLLEHNPDCGWLHAAVAALAAGRSN